MAPPGFTWHPRAVQERSVIECGEAALCLFVRPLLFHERYVVSTAELTTDEQGVVTEELNLVAWKIRGDSRLRHENGGTKIPILEYVTNCA